MQKNQRVFAALENQVAAQREQRTTNYFQALEQGDVALQLARIEGFKHPWRLQDALQFFLKALALNRQTIEPYLRLACLFLLVNNRSEAEKYLFAGLTCEPQHPKALALLSALSAGALTPFRPPQPGEAGRDAAYERLIVDFQTYEQQLDDFTARIPPAATDDPHALQCLQSEYLVQRTRLQTLAHDLQALSTEFPHHLAKKMVTFEKRLQLYARVQQCSVQLSQQRVQIQQAIQEIQLFLPQLQTLSETDLHRFLETQLDRCDQLADQLDDLAHQDVDIRRTEADYERLLRWVTHLQDIIDERSF